MEMVRLIIDGRSVEVPQGSTILQAAKAAGVEIPTLCYHPDQKVKANCRVCVVEVEGSRVLQPACAYPVARNMVVHTATPKVREARRTVVELLLSHHPQDCLQCDRNLKCELQSLSQKLGVRELPFEPELRNLPIDESSVAIVRDPNKCINCGRCVEACHDVQGVGVLYATGRGYDTVVAPSLNKPLAEVPCVLCGQCIQACPVGAIIERDDTSLVWTALSDPKKHVIVQTAPAIRVAIGEELGMGTGSLVTGKLVAALRRLGFAKVFDTDFTADLTIMEEGHELLERLAHGGRLPMITSCSPGWINYIEHYYPELLDHLSTCKSPQQMFGALAKTYYAEKMGIDPAQIVVVSVMPCTAKKYEAHRTEMNSSGQRDVDVVLTTRELGKMLREAGIDFTRLHEETFDEPLGISTGAGVIFGATGGVMEAALRTVHEVVTGKELPGVDFAPVRGMNGVKQASADLDGLEVRVAVAHGLQNAKQVLEAIKAGNTDYHFIEIMSCPGGCIGGGGQPIGTTNQVRQQRMAAIYAEDRTMPLRKSHDNPAVQALYSEFLGQPLGERSHHLLHTHYEPKSKYPR
ncbi:MAG: NADH-dependent [FeFe] hydrogenase, group A6 [Bacillota bacterium]